jgi:ankyrin repeat protein
LTAIDAAACYGFQDVVAVLIDHGINVAANALEMCASRNRVECMRTILQRMGDMGFSDASRLEGVRVALKAAATCWHEDAVRLLLTHVDGFPQETVVQDQSSLGVSLINVLSFFDCDDGCRDSDIFGRPERLFSILEMLVAAGADVNFRDEKTHQSPFWAAVHPPIIPPSVVYFLLAHGLRVEDRSFYDELPIFAVAGKGGELSLVEALVAAGAKVNVTNWDLTTPLHGAANRSIAQLLLDAGADPHAKDEEGKTPLHMACQDARVDVLALLIAKAGIWKKLLPKRNGHPSSSPLVQRSLQMQANVSIQ